jgi:hypothetical protein
MPNRASPTGSRCATLRRARACCCSTTPTNPRDLIDALPDALLVRPISLRGFDAVGMMLEAELAEGVALRPTIGRLLSNPDITYLHAHYARPGCYAALIERA